MLKNMHTNERTTFFKRIYIFLGCSIIVGIFVPFFIVFQLKSTQGVNAAVSLSNIACYLRFLAGSKSEMILSIAVHNMAVALFSFILSFFSSGVLGCLFLFMNSFVLSTTLIGVHTVHTIIFVLLEFIGICLSVFGGTALSEKRKREVCLRDLLKQATLLLSIISCVYLLAAVIEQYVITGHWR